MIVLFDGGVPVKKYAFHVSKKLNTLYINEYLKTC